MFWVARWDGTDWSVLAGPEFNGADRKINDLAVIDDDGVDKLVLP